MVNAIRARDLSDAVPELVSFAVAAAFLGVSVGTIDSWKKKGKLTGPPSSLARGKVHSRSLVKFVEQNEVVQGRWKKKAKKKKRSVSEVMTALKLYSLRILIAALIAEADLRGWTTRAAHFRKAYHEAR